MNQRTQCSVALLESLDGVTPASLAACLLSWRTERGNQVQHWIVQGGLTNQEVSWIQVFPTGKWNWSGVYCLPLFVSFWFSCILSENMYSKGLYPFKRLEFSSLWADHTKLSTSDDLLLLKYFENKVFTGSRMNQHSNCLHYLYLAV